jgi:hypothetical protein
MVPVKLVKAKGNMGKVRKQARDKVSGAAYRRQRKWQVRCSMVRWQYWAFLRRLSGACLAMWLYSALPLLEEYEQWVGKLQDVVAIETRVGGGR